MIRRQPDLRRGSLGRGDRAVQGSLGWASWQSFHGSQWFLSTLNRIIPHGLMPLPSGESGGWIPAAPSLIARDPALQPGRLAGEDRDRHAFPHAAEGSFGGAALAGLFVGVGDVLGDGLSLDEPAALEVGGVVVPVDVPLFPEHLLQLVAGLAVELFLAEAGLGGH